MLAESAMIFMLGYLLGITAAKENNHIEEYETSIENSCKINMNGCNKCKYFSRSKSECTMKNY